MNMNDDIDYWDLPALRARAARERAHALHELHARFAAWLRSLYPAQAPRAKSRECLDCGA